MIITRLRILPKFLVWNNVSKNIMKICGAT